MPTLQRRLIAVEGLVQGVGFRPYVHRMAAARQLAGSVRNAADGVLIDVEGESASVDAFCRSLSYDLPPLAVIDRVSIRAAAPQDYHDFRIVASEGASSPAARSRVSPDVASCDDCLAELFDPGNRRFGHAFITCTACGPRFTLVRDTPYDRERTTMGAFPMCTACEREYLDPADRRFHAEAIACPECGPTLRAQPATGHPPLGRDAAGLVALDHAVATILCGGIVAVKALGGFHLACDATNDAAVARLRARKRRAAKPLAVMVRDVPSAQLLCTLSDGEQRLLASPARPIVLAVQRGDAGVAASVAPGQRALGVMLPSSPLHHLLLTWLGRPIVMTSGNRSDEPVAIDDSAAHAMLDDIADLFLTHDRPIAARCDDSVVREVRGETRVIRRARGYVPGSIRLAGASAQPILALGGHLKNTVCLAHGDRAVLSSHIGDLDSVPSRRAVLDAIALLTRAAGAPPTVLAHDLHPDYASTRIADDLAAELSVSACIAVQHHHAHIASCMAEHGVRGPVVGVAFDGAGLGADGAIWGGEFLLVNGARFTRCGHLAYVPLPGGDAAARRPWRSAAAHLAAACSAGPQLHVARPAGVGDDEWALVQQLLERGATMLPRTSSMGRLFDAAASLLGVCHVARFEGEAPMALESIADRRTTRRYPVDFSGAPCWTVDPAALIRGIMHDVERGLDVAEIAGAFHNSLRDVIVRGCERVRAESGVCTVALSGGVFMNATLLEGAVSALEAARFTVLAPHLIPCNDGGLSLGQAQVALWALEEEPCA